jgi:hypothetical protein
VGVQPARELLAERVAPGAERLFVRDGNRIRIAPV